MDLHAKIIKYIVLLCLIKYDNYTMCTILTHKL